MGERIGYSHSTLSEIENNKRPPEDALLIALVKELDSNFDNPKLDKFLVGNQTIPTKKEIIIETSVEEIFGLKFGGGTTRRNREELIKLRQLVEQKTQEMLNE